MDTTFPVQSFISFIQSLPEADYAHGLDHILENAIQYEAELRLQFAKQGVGEADNYHPYIGLFDPFSLPEDVRRARPRDWEDLVPLAINGTYTEYFPPKHLFLIPSNYQVQYGEPCIVQTYEQFLHQWNAYTCNIFSAITDWNNIIVAGGAVLASLLPLPECYRSSPDGVPTRRELGKHFDRLYYGSDIDIFLYGLDESQARKRIEQICKQIASYLPQESTFVRRANTITIYNDAGIRPIQFILRLYRSPAEVLAGFDVDCASCAFNGHQVFVNPRAFISLMRRCNTIDLTRRSPSYEVRLQKYAKRGFEVYIPSLRRERIDYAKIYDPRQSNFPQGLARLLVYEYMRYNMDFFPKLQSPWPHGRKRIRNRVDDILGIWVSDFSPKTEESAYDKAWAYISPHWSVSTIERNIRGMIACFVYERDMNSEWKRIRYNRTTHRHYITCSNEIEDILYRCLCWVTFRCPKPTTPRDVQLLEKEKESGNYISGPITFITQNPGAQLLTGSFRPVNLGDWEAGVYLREGEMQTMIPGQPNSLALFGYVLGWFLYSVTSWP